MTDITGLDPRFATIPNTGFGRPSTADSSYTAPAATATCWTAGAKSPATGVLGGGQVKRITIRGLADIAADCICRIFIHDGTNHHLIDEVLVPLTDGSSNDPQAGVDKFYDDVTLEDGWTIRCTTSTGDDLEVTVFGFDF